MYSTPSISGLQQGSSARRTCPSNRGRYIRRGCAQREEGAEQQVCGHRRICRFYLRHPRLAGFQALRQAGLRQPLFHPPVANALAQRELRWAEAGSRPELPRALCLSSPFRYLQPASP